MRPKGHGLGDVAAALVVVTPYRAELTGGVQAGQWARRQQT